MSVPSVFLAEELLALPAEQRRLLAQLLTDSVRDDGRTDEQIRHEFRSRLEDLRSGRDPGLSFEEVFGENP